MASERQHEYSEEVVKALTGKDNAAENAVERQGCHGISARDNNIFKGYLSALQLEENKNVKETLEGVWQAIYVDEESKKSQAKERVSRNASFLRSMIAKTTGYEEYINYGDQASAQYKTRTGSIFYAGIGMISQIIEPVAVHIEQEQNRCVSNDIQINKRAADIVKGAAVDGAFLLGCIGLGSLTGSLEAGVAVAATAKAAYNVAVNSLFVFKRKR